MKRINNDGFTLIETLMCFIILGIIMIIASQIIHSSTEVYYYNRTTSYGIQASQIASTELRGDIEDALPLNLIGGHSSYYIYINSSNKSIEFIDEEGKQVKYILETSSGKTILKKYSFQAYDKERLLSVATTENYPDVPDITFDAKYLGMGYEIKNFEFSKFNRNTSSSDEDLGISDCPVLNMKITVCNNQYGEYDCLEYVPIYSLYRLDTSDFPIWDKIKFD